MILKVRKFYLTRCDEMAEVMGILESGGVFGHIRRSMHSSPRLIWRPNGRQSSERFMKSDYDLMKPLFPQPFTTWMCQVGTQPAMPAPSKEIAKEWAAKSQGRAFRVMEMFE